MKLCRYYVKHDWGRSVFVDILAVGRGDPKKHFLTFRKKKKFREKLKFESRNAKCSGFNSLAVHKKTLVAGFE